MRSATRDSTTAQNYAHTKTRKVQNSKGEPKNIKTSVPATASHTSCLSSPPAATLHGKTHGFVLRLPPQNQPHAIFIQSHYIAFCSSTCTFNQHITTSLSNHFPQSPSFVTTLRSSTCTFIQHVTTSLSNHFPSSPLPFVTTALGHCFPKSPLPKVTIFPFHYFPSSPPFVTTLSHHP